MWAASEADAEQIGRTQAQFREINNWLEGYAAVDVPADDEEQLLCECGIAGCGARITISHGDYARLRADPAVFAVFPDPSHVFSEVESVIARNDRYWVVKKRGAAASFAVEEDAATR